MTARVYRVEHREERLLAPVLTLLGLAVAVLYMVVGSAFIVSAWESSPGWCVVGLVLFALKKLTWRR
jgi:hypothetical protein